MFCIGGGESISGKRAVFNRASVECKLAVDDDKTRNIDMVPKGTRCGPNKVKPLQRPVRRSPVARVGCFGQFLPFKRVCSGLPRQQVCGRVGVRTEGGVRGEMQQQWGEGFAARLFTLQTLLPVGVCTDLSWLVFFF